VHLNYIFPIALFALLISAPAQSQQSNNLEEQNSNARSSVVDLSPEIDHKTYLQALLTKGVTLQEAQLLVLYKIKQTYITQTPKNNYWQASSAIQPVVDSLSQTQQVRSTLLATFGETARNNMLFKEVFYPLAHEADYLSSADQISLFEQMAKQQAVRLDLLRQGQDPQLTELLLVTGDPSQILSAPAALEWKLRQSYLAQRLRDSGVSFTEATFRTSYKLLAPIYDLNATAMLLSGSDLRDAINALEELLGKDDAIRVQAALDPRFPPFQTLAQQQGLTPQQVITAFATVLQAKIQLMFAFDLIPQDKARALEVVKHAKRVRDNSLASLVGKERAALLIEAYEAPALANQG
jgi:hypothetical protein